MQKERKARFDTLYGQIMRLFLLVLLPAMALGIYSYFHAQRTAIENARQTIQRQIAAAAEELDKRLEGVSAIYQVLINNAELRELKLQGQPDAQGTRRLTNTATLLTHLTLLNGALSDVALYTGHEKVVTSQGIFPAQYYFEEFRSFDGRTLSDWKALLAGRENVRHLPATTMTLKTVDRYTRAPVIPVISVFTMGAGRGLLLFVVDLNSFLDTLAQYVPYAQARFAIQTAEGETLLQAGPDMDMAHALTFEYDSAQNRWTYAVSVSRAEVMVTARQMTTQILVIILSVLAVGVVLAVFAGRSLYLPLGNIQAMLFEEGESAPRSHSLERLEQQVSTLMRSSSDRRAQLYQLAQAYAQSVFQSQTMTEKKAALLETLMTHSLGFHGGPYQCAALRLSAPDPALEEVARNVFARYFPVYALPYGADVLLLIFELDGAYGRRRIEGAVAELFRAVPGQITGVTVGSEITQVKDLHRSINASLTVLQRIDASGREALLFSEDFDISNQCVYTYKEEMNLVEALQRNEGDDLHRQLDSILLRNYERCVSYAQIQHLFEQLRNTAYRYAQEENVALPPRSLEALGTFDAARTALHALYGQLLEDAEARTRGVHIRLAEEADAYIRDHFAEDIYLETLAGALGVSAKHLSRVYKQHMGVNLSDRIATVRIEHAKKLLADTDLPVNVVMERSGFVSRATFIRSFRKYAAISPSAFRRIHNAACAAEEDAMEDQG